MENHPLYSLSQHSSNLSQNIPCTFVKHEKQRIEQSVEESLLILFFLSNSKYLQYNSWLMSNHLDNWFPCKLSTRAPIQLFRSKERRLSEDGCLIMGSPYQETIKLYWIHCS